MEKRRARAMEFVRATSAASVVARIHWDPRRDLLHCGENGVRREKVPLVGHSQSTPAVEKGFNIPSVTLAVRSTVELRPWSRDERRQGPPADGCTQSGRPPKSLDVGGSA